MPAPTAAAQGLVSHYGLGAVLLGTFLEGEAVLLAAGALADRGLLRPASVWLVAALGGWAGHVVWFWLGRLASTRPGMASALRWPPLAVRLGRVDALVRRHPTASIFTLQYLYGVRIVGAIALGLTALSWRRFLVTEACSCLLWAALFVGAGYAAGEVATRYFAGWLRWLWVGLSVGVILTLLHLLSRRAGDRVAGPPPG